MDLEWMFRRPDWANAGHGPLLISLLLGGSWGHVGSFFAIFHIFWLFFGLLMPSWLVSSIVFDFVSILKGFWEGFGRVLEGFFEDFFDFC